MSDRNYDKETRPAQDPEILVMNATLPSEAATDEAEIDEITGASPGTAQACDDLGLNSLADNLKRFNIKPPGQA